MMSTLNAWLNPHLSSPHRAIAMPDIPPAISVIIPVYNGAATLRSTVESVLAQTFSDFELLIIDDGSRDRTAEVAQAIADPRIQVHRYANAGVSPSRNRGAARSRGRYLSFIDADDWWTPDKLAAQYHALEAHPAAAVAFSWVDCVDGDRRFLRRGGYQVLNGQVYERLLLVDGIESGSNVMIRRDAYCAVGGFDETLTHSEDWDLWIRLAKHYDYVTVPRPQILYRQAGGTASANVWKMEAASRQIIDREAATLPRDRTPLATASYANRYKILTFEALDGDLSWRRSLTAWRYLRQVLRLDPAVRSRRGDLLRLRIKLLARLLLPAPWFRRLLDHKPNLAHIEVFLLAAIQTLPPV